MRNRREGVEIERLADFVSLVIKSPRVASEIADLLDVAPNTVRRWLDIFEAEGLMRRSGYRLMHNSLATVWVWAR